MTRRILIVVALLLCWRSAALADAVGEARAHFELGRKFFEAKAYQRAIVEYEAAYKAKPLPDFLFNIAQAYREMGERQKAMDAYRRFLELSKGESEAVNEARQYIVYITIQLDKEAKDAKDREERRKQEAAEEEARHKPGRLHVVTSPDGALVTIDGVSRGPAPIDVELPPGKHDVSAELARHERAAGAVEVPPGGSAQLALDLPEIVEACPAGQQRSVDTRGHCCWPGQVYENDRCLGVPSSCLATFAPDVASQTCACADGRVEVPGAPPHCCWPGEAWSVQQDSCVGVPVCPRPLVAEGSECVRETFAERSRRAGEEEAFAPRKTRGVRFMLGVEIYVASLVAGNVTSTDGTVTNGQFALGPGGFLGFSLGLQAPLTPRLDLAATIDLGMGEFTGTPVHDSFEPSSSNQLASGNYTTQVNNDGLSILAGGTIELHARPISAASSWIVMVGARVVGPALVDFKVFNTCSSGSNNSCASLHANSNTDAFLGAVIGTGFALGRFQGIKFGARATLGSTLVVPAFAYSAGPFIDIVF